MNIWLVEDDGFKREKIREFLHNLFPTAHIEMARSAKAAFRLIGHTRPDLVVLDMSLPTFDIGPQESGGRPQGFGGVEVLRQMDRRSVVAPVVVVTQYEVFESADERMGLNELSNMLRENHSRNFVSLVYYETASDLWMARLKNAIEQALSKRESNS